MRWQRFGFGGLRFEPPCIQYKRTCCECDDASQLLQHLSEQVQQHTERSTTASLYRPVEYAPSSHVWEAIRSAPRRRAPDRGLTTRLSGSTAAVVSPWEFVTRRIWCRSSAPVISSTKCRHCDNRAIIPRKHRLRVTSTLGYAKTLACRLRRLQCLSDFQSRWFSFLVLLFVYLVWYPALNYMLNYIISPYSILSWHQFFYDIASVYPLIPLFQYAKFYHYLRMFYFLLKMFPG